SARQRHQHRRDAFAARLQSQHAAVFVIGMRIHLHQPRRRLQASQHQLQPRHTGFLRERLIVAIDVMIVRRLFRSLRGGGYCGRGRKHTQQHRRPKPAAHQSKPELFEDPKHAHLMDFPQRKEQIYSVWRGRPRPRTFARKTIAGEAKSLSGPSPAPPRISAGIRAPLAQFDGTPGPRAPPPAADPIAEPGRRNNSRSPPDAEMRMQSLFRRKLPVSYPGDTSFRDSVWLIIRSLPAPPTGGYPLLAPCPGMPLPVPASTWDFPSSAAPLAALPSSSPAASALKLAPNLTIPSLHPVPDTPLPAPFSPPQQKPGRTFAS